MSPKKTPYKIATKKAVKELYQGSEKNETSSKFEDVFDVDYSAPPTKVIRKLRGTQVSKYWGSLSS